MLDVASPKLPTHDTPTHWPRVLINGSRCTSKKLGRIVWGQVDAGMHAQRTRPDKEEARGRLMREGRVTQRDRDRLNEQETDRQRNTDRQRDKYRQIGMRI